MVCSVALGALLVLLLPLGGSYDSRDFPNASTRTPLRPKSSFFRNRAGTNAESSDTSHSPNLFGEAHRAPYFIVHYCMSLACLFAISLHHLFFCLSLVSSFTALFQVVVFLILEPLGVDFELPSRPSHPQKSPFSF